MRSLQVVRARFKEEQKAEQKRLGKQQLDLMLNKSTTILQAQQLEMAGEESSDENPGQSETDEDDDDDEEEDDEDAVGQDEVDADDSAKAEVADEGEAQSTAASPVAARSSTSRAAKIRRRPARKASAASSLPADVPADGADESDEPDDTVFTDTAEDDAERAQEDDEYAAEMEKEDESDNDEMANLAAEADMPIEELLRRSGYAAMIAEEGAGTSRAASTSDGELAGADSTEVSARNSNAAASPSTPGTSAEAAVDLTAEEKEAEAMSEFGSDAGENERDEEDQQFEQEMEADQGESDDEEMKGLAEDADLPIEELMRKYGYGPPMDDAAKIETEADAASDGADVPFSAELVEQASPDAVKHEVDEPSEGEADASDAGDEDEGLEEIATDGSKQDADRAGLGADRQVVHFKPPFLLRATLRPYQQAGLEWLASLYTSGVNGFVTS